MIYYKIETDCQRIYVKRLSEHVPLFKVLHSHGAVEIYNNPVSEKWSILFRSNPKDTTSAETIGLKIKQFYQSKDFIGNHYLMEDVSFMNNPVLSIKTG